MPHPIEKWLASSFLGLCLTQPAVSATKVAQPEKVFGWVEEGVLMPEKISVKIKMDTGALTSSLDAKDLAPFKKNGDQWVRFSVKVKDSPVRA